MTPLTSVGPVPPEAGGPTYLVREAQWKDVADLVELYIRGSGEGRRFYHPFRFDPVIVRLVFSYFVLSRRLVPALMRLFPHRAAVIVVAADVGNGRVIGFGTVRFVRREGRMPAGKYGFLVDQRFRGQGIGTRLGEVMLSTSRALGLTEGVATILKENQASVRVAERFGFRVDPSTFRDRGAPGQPTVEIQGDLREVGHGSVPPIRRRGDAPPP